MTRFDDLYELGRTAILSRTHDCDKPPVDGGRWGIAVILKPTKELTARLGEITNEAMRVAGTHHWPTGSPSAAHITVRALEPHRSNVPDDDPSVARYAKALLRAAARSKPILMTIRGITLTPSCVMACAEPDDDSCAARFADALHEELGPDAWLEEHFDRNIWYSTLVHFAGPIDDPQGLVQWVSQRRETLVGRAILDEVQLIRYTHNGHHTEMVPLASAVL
jgi:hypothetical protein